MPRPGNRNPLTSPLKGDPEHMMKLLIALNRALDINGNNGSGNDTHKNADAHQSRRR